MTCESEDWWSIFWSLIVSVASLRAKHIVSFLPPQGRKPLVISPPTSAAYSIFASFWVNYNHLTKSSGSFLYYLLWWSRFRVIAPVWCWVIIHPSADDVFIQWALLVCLGLQSVVWWVTPIPYIDTVWQHPGRHIKSHTKSALCQAWSLKSERLPYLTEPSFPQTRVMVLTTPTSLLVLLLELTNVLTNTEVSVLLLHQPHIMNKISRPTR